MTEINFYYIEEKFINFLSKFLLKIIENNKKIILYSTNETSLINLNKLLWTFDKTSFLPHLLYKEDSSEETPILLSNTEENIYNSNFLLFSSFIENLDFLKSFEKTYYIFYSNNQESIENAKNSWNFYKDKNFTLKFCKKNEERKYIKYDEFNI